MIALFAIEFLIDGEDEGLLQSIFLSFLVLNPLEVAQVHWTEFHRIVASAMLQARPGQSHEQGFCQAPQDELPPGIQDSTGPQLRRVTFDEAVGRRERRRVQL